MASLEWSIDTILFCVHAFIYSRNFSIPPHYTVENAHIYYGYYHLQFQFECRYRVIRTRTLCYETFYSPSGYTSHQQSPCFLPIVHIDTCLLDYVLSQCPTEYGEAWNPSPKYWPFMRGIPHKGPMSFDGFFIVGMNKHLIKQWKVRNLRHQDAHRDSKDPRIDVD